MSDLVYPVLPGLGYSVIKTPNWGTRMQRAVSGRTLRTADWINPIWSFTLTYEVLDDGSQWGAGTSPTDFRTLIDFFNARQGAFDDFLFDDPTDNSAVGQVLIPVPTDTTGTQFQLVRQLAPGGRSEWVIAPNDVNAVYINGTQTFGYSLDTNTGIITFPSAIGGQTISADFTFFFRVYFPDALDFENFVDRLWSLKQVKLTSLVL